MTVVDGEGGLPSYKIVEELADDNEVWAEAFLKGWAKFLKNGNSNLREGSQGGLVRILFLGA